MAIGDTSLSYMNSLNAVGFLALGSLMNAVPALMPSLVARGPLLGDMTTSALWLHLMGMIMGLIGSAWMMREVRAHHAMVRSVPARRSVTVPQTSYAAENNAASQVA